MNGFWWRAAVLLFVALVLAAVTAIALTQYFKLTGIAP